MIIAFESKGSGLNFAQLYQNLFFQKIDEEKN